MSRSNLIGTGKSCAIELQDVHQYPMRELAAQVGNGFEDSAGNNVALDSRAAALVLALRP